MQISVLRDATVPAFSVTIDELAELRDSLCQEFPDDEPTDTRIEISDGDVDYDFSSFDDLRENYHFAKAVTDFRLKIESLERSIEVGKPYISFSISNVTTAPMVDYKIHWLKMMSVPESRAVVGRHDRINGRDSLPKSPDATLEPLNLDLGPLEDIDELIALP